MNMRIGKRLFLVGLALGLVLAGCNGGDSGTPKSDKAEITALILSIDNVGYPIIFADDTDNIELPVGASIPSTVAVNSVTLSEGASGLKSGDTIKTVKVDATNVKASIKITAEDGITSKDYTVTVTISDKLNLSSVTLSYSISPIKAVENFPNAIGSEPAWDIGNTGGPTPTGITYSIDASTTSGPTTDGTEGTPVVAIDPNTGKITITADAVAANSGAYTVTATAGADSNYLNDAPQTVDVTVEITATKASLDTTAFTYAEVETTAGTANDIGVEPVWDAGNLRPVGITYEISGGSGSGTTVVIDTNTGKITITADAEADHSGTYTVTTTAGANSNYSNGTTKNATVTVTIAKRDLSATSTVSFSYASVAATEGTANTNGVTPTWNNTGNDPVPDGITYSLTGYSGSGTDGRGSGVEINTADGTITITEAAIVANDGDYQVTATAGPTSNYKDGTTKTATVTVTIAKRDLNTAIFSYTAVETNEGVANTNGVTPVWTPATGAPTPDEITYSITPATSGSVPNTDGIAASTVEIDQNTGKITITADAVEANSGDYTVEATAGSTSSYLDGSKQTATVTVNVIVYSVGATGPAGGKVFYDEGDYTKGWRYLEAAPSDQGGGVVTWGATGAINGGTQDGIGSGEANTANIVATLGDNGGTNYAAKMCDELVEGGKADWFLPSKDELNELYQQKVTVGNFSTSQYWASSMLPNNTTASRTQRFSDGIQGGLLRTVANARVRAVRSF